jgi:hypothetical protein
MISFRHIAKYMDPVYPPNRFRGSSSSWLDENLRRDWLTQEAIKELDSFPIRQDVGLWHKQDKGLLQMYRWRQYNQPKNNTRPWSFRDVAKRHQHPEWTFKMLWYNTWLLNDAVGGSDKPDYEKRTGEIGEAIARHGYHLVGLCEVFGEDLCETIAEKVRQSHHADWKRGASGEGFNISSGLMTLAIDKVMFGDVQRIAFENDGGHADSWAKKGVLYTELKLQLPNSNLSNPAIDFFITHTHSEESDTRFKQLEELFAFVEANRKLNNPVIIAGDMNIDAGNKSEYPMLLSEMAKRDFYDIWLSRGSYSGGTNIGEEGGGKDKTNNNYALVCPFEPSLENQYCMGYLLNNASDSRCLPGNRLDYVFIEEPKAHHSIMIDIPRVQRQPFWRGIADNRYFWANKDDEIPNFLSDHLGLELELVVTPMADI